MLFLKIIFSGIVSISTANVIQTPCPNKKILGTTLVHLKNNGKVKVIRWSTGRKYFCCILPITIHYYPEKSNKDALPPTKNHNDPLPSTKAQSRKPCWVKTGLDFKWSHLFLNIFYFANSHNDVITYPKVSVVFHFIYFVFEMVS